VTPEVVRSVENFGADPPTGSATIASTELRYLYAGTGDPWAGQDRLNGCDEYFRTVELISSPENFGAEPPTGSENIGSND
jgi:hypothetical protein